MHICFVETGYPWGRTGGGAGVFVRTVGRELVRRGNQVSVVARPASGAPFHCMDQGIQVFRPPEPTSLNYYLSKLPLLSIFSLSLRHLESGLFKARFLNQLHRKQPIDLIEFTEGGDFWHSFDSRLRKICHLHGSRYTFRRKSGRSVQRADRLHRALELRLIRSADWVIGPSDAILAAVFDEELRKDRENSTVIPLPVDPEWFELPKLSADRISPTVLFCARNDPVKGADTLLDAVPLVRRELPQARFNLFGFEAGATRQLPEGVSTRQFVPREQLLAEYQKATVCVIPSLWDNSPNTVYEAMAAARPVVASEVGGIPELVRHGSTGLLVPPKDPAALAKALISVLKDLHSARSMGLTGRERISHLSQLERNVKQRLALYEKLTTTD